MSVLTAVRKMIGVVRLRSRPRMNLAVSKPSMPGIWTSSRTTAKSSSSSALSASSPEPAARRWTCRGSSTASSASRFSGRSSTSRTLGVSSIDAATRA
jgi:hypothetical protein